MTRPGDAFLRLRSTVLDTLLSDPELSRTGSDVSDPGGGGGDRPKPQRTETDSKPEGLFRASMPLNRPRPEAQPRAERHADPGLFDDPRASQHIHALLDGGSGPESMAGPNSNFSLSQRRGPGDDTPTGVMAPPTRAFGKPRNRFQPTRHLLRNPKVLAVAGCALAALLLLIFVTTGSKPKPSPGLVIATAPPPPAGAPTGSPPGPGGGGSGGSNTPSGSQITVRQAVTQCPAGSTNGMDAFSGEPRKAWSCVRAYQIDGQVMTIELGKSYHIDSIGIVPGFDFVDSDGVDQWTKHRTVARVSYEFEDGEHTTLTQDTMSQRKLVVTPVDPPVTASEVVLTVLKSDGDRSVNDVAISSIVITGK